MKNYDTLINVLNLGAGVQSSTMALMAAKGIIKPMPVAAIFADTEAEPMEVYAWLEWLERQLPFPVYRVKHHGISLTDSIMRATLRDKKAAMPIPVYTQDAEGKKGAVRRQCTRNYKIRPIERKAKELMGHKKHAKLPTEPKIAQWIGISSDEIVRAKQSRNPWAVHRFPLCFELKFSRQDCIDWMAANGYPRPPRSACYFCPYHSQDEWNKLKANPFEWERAVKMDEKIRKKGGMRGDLFLSSQCVPLREMNEYKEEQLDLFHDECEGMCGV